jgi:parallel beta-helix repeat protein
MSVSSATWKLDGSQIGSIQYTAPYSLQLNTAAIPNGTHTISLYVLDAAGNATTTSISIIVYNAVPSPDPVVPSTPTPTVTTLRWATTNTLFTNTLEEHSLASIEAELLIDSETGSAGSETDEWINVVDYGATGNGTTDDTIAIQNALNAGATLGRGVLFPTGFTFLVSAQDLDQDYRNEQYAVCLWIQDGQHIRIDGTIKLAPPTQAQSDFGNSGYSGKAVTVFEGDQGLKAIVGVSDTSLLQPVDFIGNHQGLVQSTATTHGVDSTVIELTGDPDLSSVVTGDLMQMPTGIHAPHSINGNKTLQLRIVLPREYSGDTKTYICNIASVNGSNITIGESYYATSYTDGLPTSTTTVNIEDSLNKSYYIENNFYNKNIMIDGIGTVNCDIDYNQTNYWYTATAFKFYRCKSLTIKDVKIKRIYNYAIWLSYCENVSINNVTVYDNPDTTNFVFYAIMLEFSRNIIVTNCNIYDNAITSGVGIWGSRYVIVDGCFFETSTLYGGVGYGAGIEFNDIGWPGWDLMNWYNPNISRGFFNDYSPNIPWNAAYGLSTAQMTITNQVIGWHILYSRNTVNYFKYGISILNDQFSQLSSGGGFGHIIKNNVLTSNFHAGLVIDNTKGTLIKRNTIKGNGWGGHWTGFTGDTSGIPPS